MPAKVYFLNDRANKMEESIQFKAVKVLRDAGIADTIKPGDRVGIKTHMGEWAVSFNLRPQWVRAIVDEVKRLGGKPVVFDGTVIPGGPATARSLKRDYLHTAMTNGFTEETMGCPIAIIDGDVGIDDVKFEVKNGVYLKYTLIGKGALDFDAILVVSHFKGHAMGVFGGALKNIGIGMASTRGKLAIHYMTHPDVGLRELPINQDAVRQFDAAPNPNFIDMIIHSCPHGAFSRQDGALVKDKEKCKNCGYCFYYVFAGLFAIPPEHVNPWAPAIADSASGIIDHYGKDKMIFLNYAFDLTPGCDCLPYSDKAMVPNIGVFASKDPVAVDMACIEAAEDLTAVPGSVAEEYGFSEPHTERFTHCSSFAKITQWAQLNAGAFNGAGTTEYILVRSETEPRPEFWPQPYSPAETFFLQNKNIFKDIDMDVGDYSYDVYNPRLSAEELAVKPAGKVKEISIQEDQ